MNQISPTQPFDFIISFYIDYVLKKPTQYDMCN